MKLLGVMHLYRETENRCCLSVGSSALSREMLLACVLCSMASMSAIGSGAVPDKALYCGIVFEQASSAAQPEDGAIKEQAVPASTGTQ